MDSLLPQLEAIRKEFAVELLVSDNASTDDTESALEAYQKRGLAFRYVRNPSNLGADANILQCFELATGRYVWIVGDDDIILAGALVQVVSLLKREELDIVHLRAKLLIDDMPQPERTAPLHISVTQNAKTFTLECHVDLTFISGNIVNKERVLSVPHAPFPELIGTNLVQLGWTYTLLRQFRRGAYISEPIVAAGADARGGYALFKVFGANLKSISEKWLARPELTRIILNGTLQIFFLPFVLNARRGEEAFLDEKYEELLSSLFSDNYRYHLFVYPLMKLPPSLGYIWFILCRVINRINRAMGNPMLR
jgi:glycosyltransferase involved in cell wall biosynthesis